MCRLLWYSKNENPPLTLAVTSAQKETAGVLAAWGEVDLNHTAPLHLDVHLLQKIQRNCKDYVRTHSTLLFGGGMYETRGNQ